MASSNRYIPVFSKATRLAAVATRPHAVTPSQQRQPSLNSHPHRGKLLPSHTEQITNLLALLGNQHIPSNDTIHSETSILPVRVALCVCQRARALEIVPHLQHIETVFHVEEEDLPEQFEIRRVVDEEAGVCCLVVGLREDDPA